MYAFQDQKNRCFRFSGIILDSFVDSLTNPMNIYKTFTSRGNKDISINIISSHIEYLENAFLVKKSGKI